MLSIHKYVRHLSIAAFW